MALPLEVGMRRPSRTSSSRPQLHSDLEEHSRRRLYGKPVQKLSSKASHFIPYRPHDLVFTSLRLVIFQIHPTSATPIAHLLRDDLDDAAVFKLLNGVQMGDAGRLDTANHPNLVSESPVRHCTALRRKMDEARALHAIRLRDEGMRDVDIIYRRSRYEVEPLKSDKARLVAMGGRPYHMYPFRQKEQITALSIIVKAEVLEIVFPRERCASLGITIKTNTAPASEQPSETQPCDCVISSLGPCSEADPNKLESPVLTPNERVDRVIERIALRTRSDSVQRIINAPRKPSNLAGSTLRAYQSHSVDGKLPFLGHPGFIDEAWWTGDWEKHLLNVNEWDQKTWKNIDGSWRRHLTDVPPEQSVAGEDYPVMRALGNTYVPSRNPKWHEENVVPADLQEKIELCEGAEQNHKKLIDDAKNFNQYFALIATQARQRPWDRRVQEQLRAARQNQQVLNLQLAQTQQAVEALRKAIRDLTMSAKSKKFDDSDDGLPIGEDPVMSLARLAGRQNGTRPGTPRPLGNAPKSKPVTAVEPAAANANTAPHDHTDARESAVLDRGLSIAWQPLRSSVIAQDLEPFPAFDDSMAARAEPNIADSGPPESLMITKMIPQAPSFQPGARHRDLADLLNDTGVQRDRQAIFGLPKKRTVVPEPQTPVTPKVWSRVTEGDNKGRRVGNEAKKNVLVREPVVAMVESGGMIACSQVL